jgi:magnesium transporter
MPDRAEPLESSSPCATFCVAFDFEARKDDIIPFTEVKAELEAGRFIWVDLRMNDLSEAREILRSLGFIDPETIEYALTHEPATQHSRFEQYLHGVVSACTASRGGFELDRVDYFLSEKIYVTAHRGDVQFISRVKKEYHADFVRFAKTPSFLLYEIWHELLESYLEVQKVMELRVEELSGELSSGRADDSVFAATAALGADLLHFRKVVLPARAVLIDLSTRRNHLLSEATQAFLGNMVGTVEHVLQDVLVDRDILSEALNLHMSLMGHRTNQVMRQLTVVSILFLPLSFLAGVYGMNFRVLPELNWEYGYVYFWLLAVLAVAGILGILKRWKML